MSDDAIKSGDYVIVQRQGYTKLHKIKEKGTVTLASFLVELDAAVGEKYETTFQMRLQRGTKNTYALEKVGQPTCLSRLGVETSGLDNRNITDDGCSQTLTKDEILKFKDEALSSADIVGQLITNSRTFGEKTEYSQEKYMKKKEKKYFEYVQVRRPTLRLLAQMFYRQDPAKTLGVRIDDLSQILTYANVQSDGNFLLYDSGSSGLITAAVLNAIGANTTGALVHAHPGNECQKNAVVAMQFPREQLDRCINVNVYSVLRCFHQNKDSFSSGGVETETVCQSLVEESDGTAIPSKKRKLNDDDGDDSKAKKPRWQEDNEKACRILERKVDGLIVIAKEHPVSIVKELLPFLKASRSLVVFSLLREPLQDLYVHLKARTDVIMLRLLGNFMRNYQILPDRTHPEVNMTNGGYILTGFKLSY